MLRIISALDDAIESRIVTELSYAGHDLLARVQSAHEVQRLTAELRPDALIVSVRPHFLQATTLDGCDELGIRVIGVIDTDSDRQHAAALGLFECVSSHATWSEIEAIIQGAVPTPEPRSMLERSGRVIAVWGPAGSPGRSCLATSIAAELASTGRTVALIDADPYGGTIAPSLGMLDESPAFAAACRMAAHDSLSIPELERVASQYRSPRGFFWVLSGLSRSTRWPELSRDRVRSVLATCRNWVDDIVIDTGFNLEGESDFAAAHDEPLRNAATLSALYEADHIISVGAGDPISLARFLRGHAELIETGPSAQITVVMNKVRSSATGAGAQQQLRSTLSRFAGINAPEFVPFDQAGFDLAALEGLTLADAAPRSPARLAIRGFVHRELVPASAVPRSRAERRKAERTTAGGTREQDDFREKIGGLRRLLGSRSAPEDTRRSSFRAAN